MSTNTMAPALDLTLHGRAAAKPREEASATSAQKALALGLIAAAILGAAGLGRLQAAITNRDAEILLLNQARFDLETRLSDTEYRLRVLWDDVRIAEEKAQKAAKRS